jgi:hypothetical protein
MVIFSINSGIVRFVGLASSILLKFGWFSKTELLLDLNILNKHKFDKHRNHNQSSVGVNIRAKVSQTEDIKW